MLSKVRKKIVQLQNKVDTATVQFLERVLEAYGATIESEVKDILEWWQEQAFKYAENTLAYKESKYVKAYLLKNFNEELKVKDARPAMMSLRNVEAAIEIEVLKS